MRNLTVLAVGLALVACGGGDDRNGQGQNGGNQTAAGGKNGAGAKASLLDALGNGGDHATLVKAVKAAGLEKTFAGAQPYTIFAPTEAAFAKLPAGTVEGLLGPDQKGQLTALLTGHVVSGTVTAQDLAKAIERGKGKAQIATVGGSILSFAKQGDALVLSDAKGGQARVVSPDGMASNGVIHGIDGVLMPQ